MNAVAETEAPHFPVLLQEVLTALDPIAGGVFVDGTFGAGGYTRALLERGAARYCPNMREHCHFYCDNCEGVFDVDLPAESGIVLPKGFKAERYDIAIHGRCPACAGGQKNGRNHSN